MFDVVIIGGGLGGLLCGAALASEGYKVCVLEKNKKAGGCLQSFSRDKSFFNTGLNYTEGLLEGQVLHKYFKYFDILDALKLKRLDKDAFDVISYNGKSYNLAQGDAHFINQLAVDFPNERKAIEKYINTLRHICEQFPFYNFEIDDDSHVNYESLFNKGAYDFIKSLTSDTTLQNVLAGNNLLYGGVKDKTPLYLHALIVYSFIGSAWRLIDGSQHLSTAIIRKIKQQGGVVYLNSHVENIVTEHGKVKHVMLSNGAEIKAAHFISNLHPAVTLNLIQGSGFNKVFRKRIMQLENTVSFFSLYVVLKDKSFPYLNSNYYYYTTDDVWSTASYSSESWPEGCLIYTPAQSNAMPYAKSLIALAYMRYDEVAPWASTKTGMRGDAYEVFKKRKAEQFLKVIEQKFPGFKKSVLKYYTATPLTYRDYTATPQGSAYGILKNFNTPYNTLIMPKTKISNLFFTGQNLNVHGILGVTVGAVMTCEEILGKGYLQSKIRQQK